MTEPSGRADTGWMLGARPRDQRPERSPGARREMLDRLRHVAVQLETAAVLDRRASRSASPALAEVLRERAERRRRTAARVRAASLGDIDGCPRHSGQLA
jgi:hypothetical protein